VRICGLAWEERRRVKREPPCEEIKKSRGNPVCEDECAYELIGESLSELNSKVNPVRSAVTDEY
jgi:hypothetical protein